MVTSVLFSNHLHVVISTNFRSRGSLEFLNVESQARSSYLKCLKPFTKQNPLPDKKQQQTRSVYENFMLEATSPLGS